MSLNTFDSGDIVCEKRRSKGEETELDKTIMMLLVQDPNNVWHNLTVGDVDVNKVVQSNLRRIKFMLSPGRIQIDDPIRHDFVLPLPRKLMCYMHRFLSPEDSVWHIHKLMMAGRPTTMDQNRVYNSYVANYRKDVEKFGKEDIWTPPSQGKRRRAMHKRLESEGKITSEERGWLNNGKAVIRDNKVVLKAVAIGAAINLTTSGIADAYNTIDAVVPDADFTIKLSALLLLSVLSAIARVSTRKRFGYECRFKKSFLLMIIVAIYSPLMLFPLPIYDFGGVTCFCCVLYGFLTSSLIHSVDILPLMQSATRRTPSPKNGKKDV